MKLKMSVIFVSLIAIIQVALLSIMVVQDGFSSLILALFAVSLASSAFFIALHHRQRGRHRHSADLLLRKKHHPEREGAFLNEE